MAKCNVETFFPHDGLGTATMTISKLIQAEWIVLIYIYSFCLSVANMSDVCVCYSYLWSFYISFLMVFDSFKLFLYLRFNLRKEWLGDLFKKECAESFKYLSNTQAYNLVCQTCMFLNKTYKWCSNKHSWKI